MRDLFHVSPKQIEKITADGMFGDVLFFSSDGYSLGGGEATYCVADVDDDEIVSGYELVYMADADEIDSVLQSAQTIVDFAARFDVELDLETAQDLMAEKLSSYDLDSDDYDFLAELGWFVQAEVARCARRCGYRFAKMQDEHGTVYAGSMSGRLSEMVEVTE